MQPGHLRPPPEPGFQDSLDYLYGLQQFGIKLGLDNIRELLRRLGHPERTFASVHVAGTNGKGSVCAALAEILHQAGIRAGLYTSPHLHEFTERIRVGRDLIDPAQVARLTAELRALAEDIPATFFEFTTALALQYFARRQVPWVVLETGMGGRLDATNAVTPRLTIITSLCRDHAGHLGDGLARIAGEKAGIIKPGIPLVCAAQPAEALAVIAERAAAQGAPLHLAGRDFTCQPLAGGLAFSGLGLELAVARPGLVGGHQVENLGLALAAAALLRRQGVQLSDPALVAGTSVVRWPGRLEWWRDRQDLLLDGAHNEGGARSLADYLASRGISGVRWVVGMKVDKAPADLLAPLLPRAAALYCCAPPIDGALAPTLLVDAGVAAGVPAQAFDGPAAALAAARAECRPGEIVLVAGSLFLVAAVREILMSEEKTPA